MENKQKLRFIVDFCRMNLEPEKVRPGDVVNLRFDLNRFFGISEPLDSLDLSSKAQFRVNDLVVTLPQKANDLLPIPSIHPYPAKFELVDFQNLQADVMAVLKKILDRRADYEKGETPGLTQEFLGKGNYLARDLMPRVVVPSKSKSLGRKKDIVTLYKLEEADLCDLSLKMDTSLIPYFDGNIQIVSGSVRNVFLFTVCLLLRENSVFVRRCVECQRIFIGDRRKMYCSRECLNRATARNYRSGKTKKQLSRLDHKHYKLRVKRKLQRESGVKRAKVKVDRRKRITKSTNN